MVSVLWIIICDGLSIHFVYVLYLVLKICPYEHICASVYYIWFFIVDLPFLF